MKQRSIIHSFQQQHHHHQQQLSHSFLLKRLPSQPQQFNNANDLQIIWLHGWLYYICLFQAKNETMNGRLLTKLLSLAVPFPPPTPHSHLSSLEHLDIQVQSHIVCTLLDTAILSLYQDKYLSQDGPNVSYHWLAIHFHFGLERTIGSILT